MASCLLIFQAISLSVAADFSRIALAARISSTGGISPPAWRRRNFSMNAGVTPTSFANSEICAIAIRWMSSTVMVPRRAVLISSRNSSAILAWAAVAWSEELNNLKLIWCDMVSSNIDRSEFLISVAPSSARILISSSGRSLIRVNGSASSLRSGEYSVSTLLNVSSTLDPFGLNIGISGSIESGSPSP